MLFCTQVRAQARKARQQIENEGASRVSAHEAEAEAAAETAAEVEAAGAAAAAAATPAGGGGFGGGCAASLPIVATWFSRVSRREAGARVRSGISPRSTPTACAPRGYEAREREVRARDGEAVEHVHRQLAGTRPRGPCG